jgi:predicted RNA-binding protein with TRAM domain
VIELRIDSLAAGGDGVERANDGRVVFVPFAAPGDRVRVRIVAERARAPRAARSTRCSSRAPRAPSRTAPQIGRFWLAQRTRGWNLGWDRFRVLLAQDALPQPRIVHRATVANEAVL